MSEARASGKIEIRACRREPQYPPAGCGNRPGKLRRPTLIFEEGVARGWGRSCEVLSRAEWPGPCQPPAAIRCT